jgi:hypothetical protein
LGTWNGMAGLAYCPRTITKVILRTTAANEGTTSVSGSYL